MGDVMDVQEFAGQVEENLQVVARGTLRPETRFRDLPTWDSLAALNVLAAIDEAFGVRLTAEQFRGCDTVQELFDLAMSQRRP